MKWIKMNSRKIFLIIITGLMAFVFTGCIPGDGTYSLEKPAGVFWGIWHGWIAPISLVIGLFNNKIRIYEVFNTGWWYDFGFYISVISGFGGLSIFRRKKYKKEIHTKQPLEDDDETKTIDI